MIEVYAQIAIALLAVVGLILVLSFLMKKRQTKSNLMTIVSYQTFGTKKAIAAIKVGKEILLVGITPTDLKLLKTYQQSDLDGEAYKDMSDKLLKLKTLKEGLYESK
ncbi:MAG: flagellar biosynthetic protein FliO [Thermodesulfovibrionales bacterium]|nr:flagellar biosynthetic protein FliO [Thermodesulfovibrionales bacterium]